MRRSAARHPPWSVPKQVPVDETLLFAPCLPRTATPSPLISRHHIRLAGHPKSGIPAGIPLQWNARFRTATCSIEYILALSSLLRVPVETFATLGFGSFSCLNSSLHANRKRSHSPSILLIVII